MLAVGTAAFGALDPRGMVKRRKAAIEDAASSPPPQKSNSEAPMKAVVEGELGQSDEPALRDKKRRKKEQAPGGSVPEEQGQRSAEGANMETKPAISEEQRRETQRAIQQLVLKLRAEGKTEKEIKDAKQELKAKQAGSKEKILEAGNKNTWTDWYQTKEAKDERKAKLQIKHDLVVIPILWRGRHDKLDVLKAAEDIKACVAQQGVDVWLDSRRHYTPGQKFAHWEHRGVMLRIEVGPDDVQSGVCRVCCAKTPGDYRSVERKRVKLPPKGARALLLTLKEWGLSGIEVERRSGDSEGEDADTQQKGPVADEAGADNLEGNWTPRVGVDETSKQKDGSSKSKKGKKRKMM